MAKKTYLQDSSQLRKEWVIEEVSKLMDNDPIGRPASVLANREDELAYARDWEGVIPGIWRVRDVLGRIAAKKADPWDGDTADVYISRIREILATEPLSDHMRDSTNYPALRDLSSALVGIVESYDQQLAKAAAVARDGQMHKMSSEMNAIGEALGDIESEFAGGTRIAANSEIAAALTKRIGKLMNMDPIGFECHNLEDTMSLVAYESDMDSRMPGLRRVRETLHKIAYPDEKEPARSPNDIVSELKSILEAQWLGNMTDAAKTVWGVRNFVSELQGIIRDYDEGKIASVSKNDTAKSQTAMPGRAGETAVGKINSLLREIEGEL